MESDWKARAEREAAVIVEEARAASLVPLNYGQIVSLVAIGWLQGNIAGTHETLASAEQAFNRLKAAL